jgi:hypothetical protein
VDKSSVSHNLTRHFNSRLIALLCGLIIGVFFVGFWNVLPWNDAWLSGKGDLSADHLMWQFFRQTPHVQWPLSAMPNYVAGADTIFPTGNVIAPIFAKVIGLIVPRNFQYLGILIIMWFALQAYFAERLLSRFVANGAYKVIGSIFFVLSPAFVYRISPMGHVHVAAHWLILAAMYLYFDDSVRIRAWSVLMVLTVATNLYMSVVVVVIFIAAVVKELINKFREARFRNINALIIRCVIIGVLAMATFIASGYLTYSDPGGGTGFFRLNLFAFFNPGYSPTESFSQLVNTFVPNSNQMLFAEEWEGFQYIGLGVFLLLPVLWIFIWRRRGNIRSSSWWSILVASTILFLFALSNKVTFLHFEIIYWWPDLLLRLHQTFRGASRFGFALYYLITLASIVSFSKVFSKKKATMILGVLLAVTVVDQFSGLRQSHQDLSVVVPFDSVLKNAQWDEIAISHSKLVIDTNFDFQVDGEIPQKARVFSDNWFSLAKFAVDHQMSTNFGYVARPIQAFVKSEDKRVANELTSGNLDRSTIYLISSESDWIRYKDLVGMRGQALMLDGFYIIIGQ